MRINRKLVKIVRRIAAIPLAMLFVVGNLNPSSAAVTPFRIKNLPAPAAGLDDETGPVHRPLTTVGVTQGQTARINVVNSPDPNTSIAPSPCIVELCFHDVSGNLILDRSGRAVQKTATIDPHHGAFLDLNGNLVAGAGGRVVIVPCIRNLSLNDGTLAVPTVELYNNTTKTTLVLSPGVARGFDPQPDPPALPEVAFGLVGITQGLTARLYVLNAQNPTVGDPHEPIIVELTFHDANGRIFVDRAGRQTQRTVTIDPDHADFLELNGNEIAALGGRVGIISCLKVLRGSSSSLVVPTVEMYINFTQQTLLLSNFSDIAAARVHNELIVDGGFEERASPSWVLSGAAIHASTEDGTGSFPHSGTGYLALANADSASGEAFQQITIPGDATSADLTFWLNVSSNETTTTEPVDLLSVEIRNTSGALLSSLATFSNLNETTGGTYSKKGAFSLSSFKGQTVRVQFRAVTNDALSTTFRIDDVSVR
jgi:hypothetical protein